MQRAMQGWELAVSRRVVWSGAAIIALAGMAPFALAQQGTPPAAKDPAQEPAKDTTKDTPSDKDNTTKDHAPKCPVVFPHPLITEVLYAVPGGKGGDANQDGVRSAQGDEFIELINPHDKAIELEGYRLSDGEPTRAPQDAKDEDHKLEFVFPKLTLQPGEVVVVFNGFEAKIPGPVGTKAAAAEKNTEHFHGAYVFTMGATTQYQALSNQNDMVLLTSPSGEGVSCVMWDFREAKKEGQKPRNEPARDSKPDNKPDGKQDGKPDGKQNTKQGTQRDARPSDKHAETGALVVEKLPRTSGSAQRVSLTGHFESHDELDASAFSPGVFKVQETSPEAKPHEKQSEKKDSAQPKPPR